MGALQACGCITGEWVHYRRVRCITGECGIEVKYTLHIEYNYLLPVRTQTLCDSSLSVSLAKHFYSSCVMPEREEKHFSPLLMAANMPNQQSRVPE